MSFVSEFKKFAMRGNLVDLAIGFTVGAAFSTVAKSLVDDLIMPPLGLVLGRTDFSDAYVLLREGEGAAAPYASLEADMRFLCETYALDLIEGGMPSQIFISISDRPVEFGTQDPDATQVFEAYRPEDGACIWEEF